MPHRPGRVGTGLPLDGEPSRPGSRHVAADTHFKILEAAGASEINGTTDFDRTNYFETVPSNQLELALWMESDRMGYLLDKVDRTSFANQQDVVRNERRQAVENQPYGIVEEGLFHQLFPKSHPYYRAIRISDRRSRRRRPSMPGRARGQSPSIPTPPGGHYSEYQKSLSTVNSESVLGAARKYFVPDRMIVVVVGDRSKIEPEIRKLNLGTIEYRDAGGNLVKKAGS